MPPSATTTTTPTTAATTSTTIFGRGYFRWQTSITLEVRDCTENNFYLTTTTTTN